MRHPVLLALLLAPACGESEDTGQVPEDTQGSETGGDTSETPTCVEDAAGALPKDVVWITLDGRSSQAFSFADQPFPDDYEGSYGTYDLNTLEVYGANGFKLEAPATVYGAAARWTNLLAEDTPALLTVWPDFSSDGYAFDVNAPYGAFTRCLGPADDGEWIPYAFATPFEITQPFHVFVGYHRGLAEDGEGEPLFTEPELLMENFYQEGDPLWAGVRWPDLDDEYFFQGMISPFYTWQVRLAVVYHDDIAPEDKPFQIAAEAFTTSEGTPTRVGSRVAWGDYDNDGFDDLMTSGPVLWHNEGDGTFVNVTAEAIPEGLVWAACGTGGGVWGDYDNDGCLDSFGQGGSYLCGEALLHNNCDGTFTDVILESGIVDLQDDRDCDGNGEPESSPTEGAGWFDLDGDGYLDLYLANYECSSEHDYYRNYDDRFFHNNGDGTFSEPEAVGVRTNNQAGRGVTTGDFDQDGDTDLFVSNYRLDRNFFYDNLGDGTLDEVGSENGTGGRYTPGYGTYGHTIGTAVGDIDNDGDFDLVAANLAHPFYYHFSDRTNVLVNDGMGAFQDQADTRGIYYRETHSNPVLFDADNDADLDLFITNVYGYRDSDFYVNDGEGFFTLQNYESGVVVQNGWGAAAADHDNDGDVDLVAGSLYRNDGRYGAHWIQVRPVGVGRNTSAIGAIVEVEAGGTVQRRMVSGGSGTSSQDSFTLHVGLGAADTVDRITVRFPYGVAEVTIEDLAADRRIWVYSDGSWTPGFAP
ncbi:MAG: CRTAC1 family protein [Deltaproteobacteria bacterium]|nr:CRTAC1 family protein [Deltaproteobacteria bacterium]